MPQARSVALAHGLLFGRARDHPRSLRGAQRPVERARCQHGMPGNLLSLGMELPLLPALPRERSAADRRRAAFIRQHRRHRSVLRARCAPLRLPGAGRRHDRRRNWRLPKHPHPLRLSSRADRLRRAWLSSRQEQRMGRHRHLPALFTRSVDIPYRQSRAGSHRLVGTCPDADAGGGAQPQGWPRCREHAPAPSDPQPAQDPDQAGLHGARRLPRHHRALAGIHLTAPARLADQPAEHAAWPQVLRGPDPQRGHARQDGILVHRVPGSAGGDAFRLRRYPQGLLLHAGDGSGLPPGTRRRGAAQRHCRSLREDFTTSSTSCAAWRTTRSGTPTVST